MKLILLNGPSGVGKSTLAERLHQELSLSLRIEIDAWRSFISGYREHRKESLELATKHALNALETHLKAGHDVIVDKAILDMDEVIEKMRSLGAKYGAEVHEIVLMAEKGEVLRRAGERGYRPGGLLTPERVAERWEWGNELSKRRATATVIDTTHLSPDEVYSAVRAEVLGK
jgi:predicted kinase